MSKLAFIYPGQGVQKAGMGADFYTNSREAAELFDRASETLRLDLKALCFKENEKLDLTEYTQAALVCTSLAMTRVMQKKGICPDLTAGLSLGEYAAIAAAGALEEIEAIRLVRKRGILMQNTVPAGEGAMCAVMGMETAAIEQVLEEIPDASIANYNCPGQIVITGKKAAVEEGAKKLKEAGARRTVMLNVSGPFHSTMLLLAGEELKKELEQTTIKELQIPYVANVTAKKVEDAGEIKDLLVKQISGSVRWMQSMETMLADGVDTFVEIGPGKTLAGFLKKINPAAKVISVGTWEELEQTVQILL